jgi:transposase-like protein
MKRAFSTLNSSQSCAKVVDTYHLQTYEWGQGLYRRTSQMLGVSKMTAYRWVSAFGYQLLPVAALFGMVRSSGVVGIALCPIIVGT